MRYRTLLAALCALAPTAARAVDSADLKPGLVATHADAKGSAVTRLEPTVALTHGANGETSHPALGPGGQRGQQIGGHSQCRGQRRRSGGGVGG